MSIKKFTNPAGSRWSQDLKTDDELNLSLPLNFFLLKNNSGIAVDVKLWGKSVGSVERYSSDTFTGIPYESFEILNENDDTISAGEMVVHCGKDVSITQMPFNPQLDLMEENLDRFAGGCDARISKSSTITADAIKYWLNVQNALVVQRRIDLAGTAIMGSYEVDFGGGDVVAGSVPVNGSMLDTKRYKKTISGSAFDYSVSDCSIAGWVFDYKLNSDDQCTQNPVSGKTNASDDDVKTYYQGTVSRSSGSAGTHKWGEIIQWDFGEILNFSTLSAMIQSTASGGTSPHGDCLIQTSENGSDWATKITVTVNGTLQYHHHNTAYSARYIRVYASIDSALNNQSITNTVKIYDISAI